MKNNDLEILFLEPVYKHTIWGGKRLREDFGCPEQGDDIGECWAVSAHPAGDCIVSHGSFKGKHLSELWRDQRELFGNLTGEVFPLLTKIIDASRDLSIQVHPDDAYAAEHEGGSLGKTECWYVLDCPEDAELVLGHRAGSRQELSEMIDEGRWGELIKRVPVKKGDFLQIDPGTVHALTSGCLILETQENSDITYRVYDYDRLQNGVKRELHIDKSKDVIRVPAAPVEKCVIPAAVRECPENRLSLIYSCNHYSVYEMKVSGEARLDAAAGAPGATLAVEPGTKQAGEQGRGFMVVTVVEGQGEVCSAHTSDAPGENLTEIPGEPRGMHISKGDSFIIPAGFGYVELCGEMSLVVSRP
jgi:mannose-6-phosphate isomerase/beta-glucosidase